MFAHRFILTIEHIHRSFFLPNPLIFEFALDLAKVTKLQSIMIGDSLEADIEGALNAGLDAIFFNEFNVKTNSEITQVNQLRLLKNYF